MTIWTYTNNDDGPRWSADGAVVDLLTDGTFRVEGLTDVYETLTQAKERALRWKRMTIWTRPGDAEDLAEVLANTTKMSSSLQHMLNDPLAIVHFPDLPSPTDRYSIHVGDKVRSKTTGYIYTVDFYNDRSGCVTLKGRNTTIATDEKTVRKNFESYEPSAYPESEWHGGQATGG